MLLVAGACGDDDPAAGADATAGPDEGGSSRIIDSVPADRPLSGAVRDPAPAVDETTLPSLSRPGTETEFRAGRDGLLLVYFGFTNCPDVCPTTLADLTVALRKLPDELAERVDTVMVTVDPARDLDVLTDYVRSFIPDADAAGTDDAELLAAAAEPFGARYDVRTLDDGAVEVDHTPFLYAVDDEGRLALTWQFGASSDDMAADMLQLLTHDSA